MSKKRFVAKFSEHLNFLHTSCDCYDRGNESEAIRVAQSMRVLFHDTQRSKSLAKHNKMKDWEILSSSTGNMPLGEYTAFVKLELNLASSTPVRAVPKFGNQFKPISLRQWWGHEPVYSFDFRQYSRSDLVLAAANQDGGSHVDEKLKPFYRDMASGIRSLGLDGANLQYSGAAPFDKTQIQYPQNLHLAMIRQFGYEVLVSARHYNWIGRVNS
jgi:hypothetical protein